MTDPRTEGPFSEAMSTVFGVATARYANNSSGAQLLVARYLEEAKAAGVPEEDIWPELFSAAIVALCDTNADLAVTRRTSPASLMTASAMEHALAKVTP